KPRPAPPTKLCATSCSGAYSENIILRAEGSRTDIMKNMKLFCCFWAAAAVLSAQSFTGGPAIDRAIEEAIQQNRLPGAVLIVGHAGQVVYRKAYGERALVPKAEPMTVDTVFDCASLTKVVATTSSLMKLFEQGRFRLNDKVTDYIPEFQGGKSD